MMATRTQISYALVFATALQGLPAMAADIAADAAAPTGIGAALLPPGAVEADGSVFLTHRDLTIPSIGSPAVTWSAARRYSQLSSIGDTVQGQEWLHGYMDTLTLATPGSASTSDVTWSGASDDEVFFSNTASYTYAKSDDSQRLTLAHEHTGDPADTFRISSSNGHYMVFYDHEHSTTAYRLRLFRIEDESGNRLEITLDSSTGRVDYITDPSGHYFRYSYVSGGDNDGKLDYIRVFKSSGTADADLIARIDYTYKASADGNDSGVGTTGDLIQVDVKTHKTDETGTTFAIQRTVYYRYYKDADSDGNDHQLKMVLEREHANRAEDALGNVLTETDANVDDYATYLFEYDGNDRVSEMIAASASAGGCGGCGGGSEGTFTYTYSTQSSSSRNDWVIRAKIDHNGTTRYVLLNDWDEVHKAVLLTDDSDHSDPIWAVEYVRDSTSGQITSVYTPSAISDFNSSTNALTYVNDGLVRDFTWDSSGSALESVRVRKYSQATSAALYVQRYSYEDAPTGVATLAPRRVMAKSHSYPTGTTDPNDTSRTVTTYDYAYHTDSGDLDSDANTSEETTRILVRETTHPIVSTGQNGSGVAATEYEYFDTEGRVRWQKDAEGVVSYRSYVDLTGQSAYSVTDVYTGATEGDISPSGITSPEQASSVDLWADWSGAAPKDAAASPAYDFQTTGSASSYLQLATKREFDLQGRLRKSTDRADRVSYRAYLDGETRTYSPWDATTDKPLVPAQRQLVDHGGRPIETIAVDPTSVTFSDPPTGAETLTNQAYWVSWSKTDYDSSLRRSTLKDYHDIPSSGDGSDGTNYYTTTYTYASDSTARTESSTVEDPEDGYRRTTFNPIGKPLEVEMTATESSGSPTSWKTVTEYFYDQATPGTGVSKGGLGNVTQVKSYYADAGSNSTSMTYDWRGRQIFDGPPAGPKSLRKYDNLDRVVAVGTFENSESLSVSDDPETKTSGRLALSETGHNDRGQQYETVRWEITASTGAKGADLVTSYYYDRVGRSVAVVAPGAGASITRYDAAGRSDRQYKGLSLGSTIYAAGGKFAYGSDNEVIEWTDMELNDDGQPEQVRRYELESASNTTLDPASATTNALVTFVNHWYDDVGRRKQTSNYGSNSNNGLDGPMNSDFPFQQEPSYIAGSPPAASDTVLTTKWAYGSDGRLETVTNEDGIETDYEYDDLGRQTATIEDVGGIERRTETQYNGNSDTTQLIAKEVGEYDSGNPGDDDQVTEYVYGHAVGSRWVTEIRYPGSDGQPSTASADKVVFAYHHDGTVNTKTDQNQTTITYEYDTLRRKTHELVTTLGTDVDGDVRQIAWVFDDSGRTQKITSRDSATKDGGNVVNELAYTYDGLGQLTKEEQEHDGAVDGSTLSVQYAYDVSASSSDNHSRLDYITYPNGRTIYSRYTHSDAASTKQDEVADAFSRVAQLSESSTTDIYAEYTFTGLSRLVRRASESGSGWRGNDTILNYDSGTTDEYDGFDFSGRTVDQLVEDDAGTTTHEQIRYEAERDGSPKFADRRIRIMAGRSNIYAYDDLRRMTSVKTGLLETDQSGIQADLGTPSEVTYTMDVLGNITSLDRKNSGVSATETRVYNATNELTSRTVNGEAPRYWVEDTYSDDDKEGYAIADLDGDGITTSGDDGTWSATSGSMKCSATISETGAPDGGTGSILLVRLAEYQDIKISAEATLTTGCDNVGLVFGYEDEDNFFAKIYSLTQQKWLLYEKSAGTWNLRDSASKTITSGTSFIMRATVHAGSADGYSATVPAGRVGLWSSDSSNNEVDWFRIHDTSGNYVAAAGWHSQQGDAEIDSGQFKINQSGDDSAANQAAIYMPFRGEKYTAEFDFVWQADTNNKVSPGCVIHLQDFSNYMAVYLKKANGACMLDKVVDGYQTNVVSGSSVSLTNGQTYTMQIAITDAPVYPELQVLSVKVDTDQDSSFADETNLVSSYAGGVDDTWPAGYFGFFREAGLSATQAFDNLDIWIDSDDDGNQDDQAVSLDFASNAVSLSYDGNGNLTDDGMYGYSFTAWGRSSEVSLSGNQSIGANAWFGNGGRSQESSHARGQEVQSNDGGNRALTYYLSAGRHVEVRNSDLSQVCGQFLLGGGRVIWQETNGDPTISIDTDPDNTASGESGETPPDARVFVLATGSEALLTNGTDDSDRLTSDGRLVSINGSSRASWAFAQNVLQVDHPVQPIEPPLVQGMAHQPENPTPWVGCPFTPKPAPQTHTQPLNFVRGFYRCRVYVTFVPQRETGPTARCPAPTPNVEGWWQHNANLFPVDMGVVLVHNGSPPYAAGQGLFGQWGYSPTRKQNLTHLIDCPCCGATESGVEQRCACVEDRINWEVTVTGTCIYRSPIASPQAHTIINRSALLETTNYRDWRKACNDCVCVH